ncbi:hypothetical protein JCM10207_000242 [Rhodosporidiobolus poonsookiae]
MASSSAPPNVTSDPAQGQRSIQLHGWTITTTKLPILSIPQADQTSADLDLALPEIVFGNNQLLLRHEESNFQIKWDMKDMLAAVKKGEGWDAQPGAGAVTVKHADEWKRGQTASTSSTASLIVHKPYDWTYTTLHAGSYTCSSLSSASPASEPSQPPPFAPAPPAHPGIPLAQLARTDIPIFFFDEVPLFEDELGDNGIADATVRVRVNSTSFYVLARFFLRIDGVLFRLYDVRLFHAFNSGEIIRQTKGREAPYSLLRERLLGPRRSPGLSPSTTPAAGRSASPLVALPNRTPYALTPPRSPAQAHGVDAAATAGEDLTQLNDINWVAGVLDELALAEEMGGVGLGAREAPRGEQDAWEGLGVRLEVMRVPWASEGERGQPQ